MERGGGVRIPALERGLLGTEREERRDAAESRQKIVEAARRLFRERGVGSVSMHEIGRAAGVGQGTLYRRFEHKGALCAALLAEEIEDFYEETREGIEDGREPALERVAWFLERLAGFNERNADLLGGIRGGRSAGVYGNPFYAWLRATVAALLRLAREDGEVGPALDVECASDILLAALNIDLYVYQRRELGMSRGRILGAMRALLGGLRRDG